MQLRKHFSKLAAFLLASTILTGCMGTPVSSQATSEAGSAASSSIVETEAKTIPGTNYTRDADGVPNLNGETITIWLPMAPEEIKWVQSYSEYETIKNLQERLNVKLEFVHPPVGQEQDAFSIMLNSGNWPDIIWANCIDWYPGGRDMAIKDGVMATVDSYINDDYMPNFSKVILSDEVRRKEFFNDNGQLVRLGARYVTNDGKYGASAYTGPMIRKDFLEQTGLPLPETIDDWYKMLTAMKENGVEVPYGWAGKGWDATEAVSTFVSAYGVTHGMMIKEDGKVGFGPMEPGYKDYLAEMNKWYTEGLINPDFANHTDSDNIFPMLASDKVGSYTNHLWTYAGIYYPSVTAENPEKDVIPAPYPVLNKGDKPNRFRDAYYGVQESPSITTKAKSVEACVLLLDALYNPEVNYIMAGTEGVTFERGTTGDFSIDPIWKPNDAELDMRRQHSAVRWREIIDDNSTVPFYYDYPSQLEAFELWNAATYDGKIPSGLTFTEEELEINAKYSTDIYTYLSEMKMKFMVGTEPIENFDAFVEQLKKMHVEELIQIHQQALDRYNAR